MVLVRNVCQSCGGKQWWCGTKTWWVECGQCQVMGWLDVGPLRDDDVVVEAVWACSGNAGVEVDVLVRVAVEVALVFDGILVSVVQGWSV